MNRKKGALGRNILLDTLSRKNTEAPVDRPVEGIRLIGIHQVDRSPWQPRTQFDAQAITDLADSNPI